MKTWEIRREGDVVALGPAETMPNAAERKRFRADGYKIYVDGKLYKE